MDVSIWVAKDQLKRGTETRKFTCELGLFKRLIGYKDNDNTALKDGFRNVRRTEYEYNILNKDSEEWGNLSYFSDVQIIVNGR